MSSQSNPFQSHLSISRSSQRYTEEEKLKALSDLSRWQGSIASFCREYGYCSSTVYSWMNNIKLNASKVASTTSTNNQTPTVTLVDYSKVCKEKEDSIEIITPSGYQLKVNKNSSRELIKEVLLAVKDV